MKTINSVEPARRVMQVKEYYFSKKLKEVAMLNKQGLDIISLGIGGPDLPPHKKVIDTLCAVAKKNDTHGYQPYVGLPELRKAYSDWYYRWYGVQLDSEYEIQPLIGSKEGILHTTLAFVNPGDGVLVPNPGYPTYTSVSKLAEAKIYTYCLNREVIEMLNTFEKGDKLEILLHPYNNYIIELIHDGKEVINFDDSQKRIQIVEGACAVFLILLLYGVSIGDIYFTVKEYKKIRNLKRSRKDQWLNG